MNSTNMPGPKASGMIIPGEATGALSRRPSLPIDIDPFYVLSLPLHPPTLALTHAMDKHWPMMQARSSCLGGVDSQ